MGACLPLGVHASASASAPALPTRDGAASILFFPLAAPQVCNESAIITRNFAELAAQGVVGSGVDLRPPGLQAEVDRWNERIYESGGGACVPVGLQACVPERGTGSRGNRAWLAGLAASCARSKHTLRMRWEHVACVSVGRAAGACCQPARLGWEALGHRPLLSPEHAGCGDLKCN